MEREDLPFTPGDEHGVPCYRADPATVYAQDAFGNYTSYGLEVAFRDVRLLQKYGNIDAYIRAVASHLEIKHFLRKDQELLSCLARKALLEDRLGAQKQAELF